LFYWAIIVPFFFAILHFLYTIAKNSYFMIAWKEIHEASLIAHQQYITDFLIFDLHKLM